MKKKKHIWIALLLLLLTIAGAAAAIPAPPVTPRHHATEQRQSVQTYRLELFLLLGITFVLGGALGAGAWRYLKQAQELRKNQALIRHLPLRLCVLNREDEILLYQDEHGSCPASGVRSLNDLPFLPQDEVRTISDNVWNDGLPRSIHYQQKGRTLVAACAKLPPEIFGGETLLWAAQDANMLDVAKRGEVAAKELLQSILDCLPVGVVVKDADRHYRFQLANPAFSRIVNRPISEIVGKDDYELRFKAFEPNLCRRQDIQVMTSNHPISLQRRNDGEADGATRTYQVIKLPLHTASGRNLLIGVFSDITRNLELEQKQQRLIDELNNRIINEQIVNSCLQNITANENFDDSIHEMLRLIGTPLQAACCFVFCYLDDRREPYCRYEWCAPDAPSYRAHCTSHPVRIAADELQKMLDNGLLTLPDMDNAPEQLHVFASMMQQKGIHSLLVLGLYKDGVLSGFCGAAFRETRPEFSPSDIAMSHDIGNLFLLAEERRKQQALRQEISLRQQRVFDSVNIPLVLYDPDFNVVMLNRAGREICGIRAESIIGTHCSRHICRYRNTQFCSDTECPLRAVRATGQPFQRIFPYKKREYRLEAQPIFDEQGNLLFILENLVDLTELLQDSRQMVQAIAAAQAEKRAKRYFIAGMSRELRGFLHTMLNQSELLKNGECTKAEIQDYCTAITSVGHSLLEMTDNVLALTQFEQTPPPPEPDGTPIAEIAAALTEQFRPAAESKGLKFTVFLPENPPTLRLDTPRLRLILQTLIGNAIRFTHRGGITVEFAFRPTALHAGTLTIQIADTGVGIREELRERLFTPAWRNADGDNRQEGGLGLTLVQLLTDQLKGSLTCRSVENRGTTVTVEIPQTATVTPVNPAAATGAWHGVHHVLLVDDVAENSNAIGAMLRKLGVQYAQADSAQEALDRLAAEKFDVILTDLQMPGLNGAELAAAIRENPANALADIYAIDAEADTDTEAGQHFDTTCFKGILRKPITLAKLMRIVASDDGNPQN